jgi:beta-propeller repeat-containing protein/ASPM-SPD-2-Hydin domain-containing protein
MSLLRFSGRSGFRRRRYSVALATLFFLTMTAAWTSGRAQARAELPGRVVQGQSETVVAPMVSEAWSATAGRANPSSATKQVRFIGHWPGFEALKQQANQAAQRKLASQQGTPLQQSLASSALAAPAAITVFDGPSESDTGIIPPDPQIAAGPNQVVVVVNSLLAIYDKTGVLQGSFQQLSSFFISLGVTGEIFDPRIVFDQTDGRFILSAAEVDMTNFTNGHVLLAVSQTSDPRGVWNKYALDFKGRNTTNTADTFPDFPTLGLSSSAVYLSTGQFMLNSSCVQSNSCSFSDTWIKVVGLAELLAGSSTLNITTFENVQTATHTQAFAVEPAVTYGAASAEFLVAASPTSNPGSTLNLYSINTSGTPVLSEVDLPVPPFYLPPDATQPGAPVGIATNDFRLLNAVWSNGSLWCGQNVLGPDNSSAAVGWYDISASSLSTLSLSQSGTVSGSGDAYYPAVTAKPNGDVTTTFTTSSSVQFASAAFTGRIASDPANTMRTFAFYKGGTGPYADVVLRWGDYSGVSTDPGGNSIWTIAEYAGSPDPHFGTSAAQVSSPPSLNLSATAVGFGDETVTFTSGPQSITITNVGASSVTLGTLTITGANAADFGMALDNCSGVTLAPSATCTVSAAFTPSNTGIRTAALIVGTNPPTFTQVVYFTGNGIPRTGTLAVSTDALTFPDTPLRTASAPQSITISNSGTTAGALSFRLQGSTVFAETNNCGNSLAPGMSCNADVTFYPTFAGVASEQLIISVPGSVVAYINLNGTGITAPAATLCPTNLTFSSQPVGSRSSSQIVTLSNTGSASLKVSGISVSGDFAQTNTCGGLPATLLDRTACTIAVTFAPSSSGTRTGTLSITDNGAGSPHNVLLTGTGVAGSAELFSPDLTHDIGARTQAILARSAVKNRALPGASLPKICPSGLGPAYKARLIKTYGRLPVSFEANLGQASDQVKYLAKGEGFTLFLTLTEAVLAMRAPAPEMGLFERSRRGSKASRPGKAINNSQTSPAGRLSSTTNSFRARTPDKTVLLRMRLVGANPTPQIAGLEELPGRTNYFIGSDPRKWHTNLPNYAKVKLGGVYPGVDLIYYGSRRRLESDFILAPGADPEVIELSFQGADRVRLEEKTGDLVLSAKGGQIRLHKPIVYQETASAGHRAFAFPRKGFINARYARRGTNEVGLQIGSYDRTRPLVIDPVLTYSTYLGGSAGDQGYGIAADSAGNAYVTGTTASANFPTAHAFQPSINQLLGFESDVFITKLSPDGSSFVYSTFLGGTNSESGYAIAADSLGNAYITGGTDSADFPVTPGAFQTIFKGGPGGDAFLTKISPNGSSLVYSTYLGGIGFDESHGIAVDASGNAYVAGVTSSPDFPITPGAAQIVFKGWIYGNPTTPSGCGDAFVTKLNAQGTGLLYSTYLGGSGCDGAAGIAVDSGGNAYITGSTYSVDFPTTSGAFQVGRSGPGDNIFVTKVNPQGTGFVYSTYLGGNGSDDGLAIAVDSSGSAYVTGEVSSTDFPTVNAFQPGPPNTSNVDAFVTKLHPGGCGLVYSTYLAGSQGSFGTGIAVDSSGSAYVTGGTHSSDFPTYNPIQATCLGCTSNINFTALVDPFVSKFSPNGSVLVFSTFLGGGNSDVYHYSDKARAIGLDPTGNVYVTGVTESNNFPTANAIEPTYSGNSDAFVAKMGSLGSDAPGALLTNQNIVAGVLEFGAAPVGSTLGLPAPVILSNTGTLSLKISSIAASGDFAQTNNCGGSVNAGANCAINVTFRPTASGSRTGTLTFTDNAAGSPQIISLAGTGAAPGPAATLSPTNVAFGNRIVGTTSAAQPLTLTNSGSASLAITSIAVSGDFAQTNNCGGSVNAGANCAINVTFTPTAPGTRTGTVTITDLALDSPQMVSLSGTGVAADFSISPASGFSTAATVTAGGTASYKLTIATAAGLTGTVNLACSGAPAESTCTVNPGSATLNGTNTVGVTVSVATTAPSVTAPRVRLIPPSARRHNDLLLRLALLALATLIVAAAARRRVRWGLGAAALFVLLWASCGGGGGGGAGGGVGGGNAGTPAGTYNLDVSATVTSGSTTLKHDIKLKLTVN